MIRSSAKSTRSLAQKAYRQLKEDILSTKLKPGEMVLGTKVSQKYKMSRTPVHEALKLLCTEGLVSVIPRVGYVVTELSVGDVQEIFQLRLALEALAAELAVDHVTDRDVDGFERLQRRVQSEAKKFSTDPAAYRRFAIEANSEFHLALARLSANERLVRLIEGLLDESRRILLIDPTITAYVDPVLMEALPTNDHGDIVSALARRDRQGAREATARHVRDGQTRIIGSLLGVRATHGAAEPLPVGAPQRRRGSVRSG